MPAENSGEAKIRVVVVDNGTMQSQLLAEALKKDPGLEVVAAASSDDLLELAGRRSQHLALISSFLEEEPMKGIELARALRAVHPHTRSVILLESSKRELILEAFRAGARGVFSRYASLDLLRTCVHQVHRGQIWADAEQMGYAVEALAATPNVKAVGANGINLLSKREMEVVTALAEGLSNREIGARLGLSPHTIKNYLFRIFDKLGVGNRMELLALTLTQPQLAKAASPGPEIAVSGDTFPVVEDPVACQRAAERGSYAAQLSLAQMYWNGLGVEQDSLAAYTWYLIAEKTHTEMKIHIQHSMRKIVELLSTDEVLEAQRAAAEQVARLMEGLIGPPPARTRGAGRN